MASKVMREDWTLVPGGDDTGRAGKDAESLCGVLPAIPLIDSPLFASLLSRRRRCSPIGG